jgi:riboflavin kinase/FMN adenylyltransferase
MTLKAKIVQGKQLGRTLGFPTANLSLPQSELNKLETGVFAGKIQIENDPKTYKTAVSVGQNSTFGDLQTTVEAYILDFDQDIYGKNVTLELLFKIREMQKFESVEELVEAIKQDVGEVNLKI